MNIRTVRQTEKIHIHTLCLYGLAQVLPNYGVITWSYIYKNRLSMSVINIINDDIFEINSIKQKFLTSLMLHWRVSICPQSQIKSINAAKCVMTDL